MYYASPPTSKPKNNDFRNAIAVIVFFLGMILFGVVTTPAGISIAQTGEKMQAISQYTDDLDQAIDYQLRGQTYRNVGTIIAGTSIVCCIASGCVAVALVAPDIKKQWNEKHKGSGLEIED